jgi:membrane-bound ClpP family serine protease
MGEIWSAKSDFPINKGDRLVVARSEGLILFLSKANGEANVNNNAN